MIIVLRAALGSCISAALELDRPSIYSVTSSSRRIGAYGAISDRYCAMLEEWLPEELEAANRIPMDFLHPLCRLIALEINHHMHNPSVQWKRDKHISLLHVPEAAFRLKKLDYDVRASFYRQRFEKDVELLRMTIEALRSPSIRQFPEAQRLLASQRWLDLLYDYEQMLDEAERNLEEFEAYSMKCMTRFSLMATTKSVQQSESFGRLSMLAFVFLLLSSITSFFGMNLAAFGTGSISFWVFLATLTILMLTMLMMWAVSHRVGRLIGELGKKIYELSI